MRRFVQQVIVFSLLPLVIIFIVELSARVSEIPKRTHHNIFAKSKTLIPRVDSDSIIFLGDSRVEWGIKPASIKKNLHDDYKGDVINLALPGSNGLDVLRYLKDNEIYPKIIIIGYTGNYGRYKNHELDEVNYSILDMISENIKYYLKQKMYISDNSILNYLQDQKFYFKSHEYDRWGGVIVFENGDYLRRKKRQLEMYEEWKDSYSQKVQMKYIEELNKLISYFKNKDVFVIGIYMPVSENIYKLEGSRNFSTIINYDKYYDFNALYRYEIDEYIYLYDGSHLSHAYSYLFSKMFGKLIDEEMQSLELKKTTKSQ